MSGRLLNLWETLRTSLWFFPGVIALLGALLAWLALSVRLDLGDNAWWLYSGSINAASALLSSFLNSLITVAALAISITMVVLTLAAQQLGPRLIPTVVSSWQTQISLGTFVAAILYLVLVLRSLPSETSGAVPNLAVTIGTGFVILCTFALLFFIHFLSRSIVADTMVERVGDALDAAAERQLSEGPNDGLPIELIERTAGQQRSGIGLDAGGYVQSIDYEGLANAAAEEDAVLRLELRPGSLIIPRAHYATVLKGAASEKLRDALTAAISIGQQRTTPQDVEYAIRQLVDIAMRGLYVRDVYTCTAVLDRLALSFARMMPRTRQQRLWRDGDGKARLLAETVTFEGMVDEAFNQIRQEGERFPSVLIHLAWLLETLFLQAATDPQRSALAKHARLVVEAGRRSIGDPSDLSELERQAPQAVAYDAEQEPRSAAGLR